MSTQHRGITAALIVVSVTWTAAASSQPMEAATVRRSPRVEIDRAAIVIDVAAQRRSLDSSIRRALAPSVTRDSEQLRLATSEARPRG